MKAIVAKKIGMTTVLDETGAAVPVTVLSAGPCVVIQVKTDAIDGYNAIQLGYGEAKNIGKSRAGHLAAAKAKSRHLAEFRDQAEIDALKVGDKITASEFEIGQKVTVMATSKGKGFAGTVKRHNFSTGPKTHGSRNYRQPGSIGAGYPQHVFAGQKMAGQMGGQQVTVKNLPIIKIDPAANLIAVRGAIPGPKRGIVSVQVISPAATAAAKEEESK